MSASVTRREPMKRRTFLKMTGIAGIVASHRAPAFALPNSKGRMVRSADLLSGRHLVVSFYRGGW